MMQSFIHVWYFTCGKSRGHTIFLASSVLVGHTFPSGRSFCRYFKCTSRLASFHLCFAFVCRRLSVKFKRVSLGSQPAYNGVFESSSRCASLDSSLEAALALVVFLRSRYRT